jgi:hypothetical protein
MSRLSALFLVAVIAAAPASAASAQVALRGDVLAGVGLTSGALIVQDRRPRDDRRGGDEDRPRLMSEAQAQSIAQSRAGGARFVGSLGLRGTSYVFRFERDGRIIDIAVDARG